MNTAARVGSINVVLNTTFGSAVNGLNTFASTVERTGQRTQRSVQGIDKSVLGMNRTMSGIRGNTQLFRSLAIGSLRTRDSIGQMNTALLATSALLGGIIPTLTGAYFVRLADRAQLVGNNLRTVTENSMELKQTQDELFQVAQRSRAAFDQTATVYARTARATEAFGLKQKELLRITETINKAFAAGGANPAEAQGAAIQLTQGIASDRFSGDEFRSVAENAPVLLKGIADSLGINIGKLREMAHAGELTAKVVTEAILRSSSSIDEAFNKTVSTIGQAGVKLDNAFLKFATDSESLSVASQGMVGLINSLSENLDTVADSIVLVAGALATTFVSRRVSEVFAYNAAVRANALAHKQATAAALATAQAETALARQQRVSAQAALNSANIGNVTASTRNKLQKQFTTNTALETAARGRLTAATIAHSQALKAASASGRAFAAVGGLVSGAWSFIGGPFGAAMLAIGGAMFIAQRRSQEAADRLERYSDAIMDAGTGSSRSAEGIREAARALEDVAEFASAATLQAKLRQSQADVKEFFDSIGALGFTDGLVSDNALLSLKALGQQLEAGTLTLDNYISKTDELARSQPDMSETIVGYQKAAKSAEAARARTEELEERLSELDGKSVDIKISLTGLTESQTESIEKKIGEAREERAKETVDNLKKMAREGKAIDAITRRMFSDVLDGVEPRKKRKTEGERLAERFQKALNKLDYTAATFGLSEIDKATVQAARSAGVADAKIRQFISAISSGGQAPEQLMQIKNRLQEIANLELKKSLDELSESNVLLFLTDVDQKTVETARSFGVAEEEVKAFIRAASAGDFSNISENISQVRDRLIEVSENERVKEGIESLSSAVSSFASDAILDFNNIGDSVKNFVSRLAEAYVQMVIIEPLMRSLTGSGTGGSLFSSLVGGGSSGGDPFAGLRVATQHTGGQAGVSSSSRVVSLADVAGAQKFHTGKSGVGHNEVMSLLEKSESVYTAKDNMRIAEGLSKGISTNGGGKTVVSLELSQDLVASIVSQAEDNAVEVSKKAVSDYNRNTMPKEAMRAVQKQVRAGKSIG